MITGLQTMPSIAWFPLAILLFKLHRERDPVRGRARRGARRSPTGSSPAPTTSRRSCCAPAGCSAPAGSTLYRHVILPASLPSFVGGLKQGWAFAWRSLMAGELLVIDRQQPSIGVQLQNASGSPGRRRALLAMMS